MWRRSRSLVCRTINGANVVIAVLVPVSAAPTDGELDVFCRKQLAGYKTPRRYMFVEELPKSPLGKVLKDTLRQQAAKGQLDR